MSEAISAAEADAHLQDRVPVVLRLQLPHSAHAAQRELEAMPVIGCRQRCHYEISLTRTGRRSRGWDRRLDALVDRWDR